MAPAEPPGPPAGKVTPPFRLLIVLWVLTVFAPQWLLASFGLSPVLKLPLILFTVLAATLVLKVPSVGSWARRFRWYLPFLIFIVLGVLTVPFATNNGLARAALTQMTLYWLLVVATATIIDHPKRAEQLLLLYGLQYLWWGLLGARSGLVRWHPVWANYDGYGAMMVGGLGICWFFYLASKETWFQRSMLLAMGLCTIGIVASFARGAFLGAAGLLGVIWLRSPRKLRALGYSIPVILLMFGAAAVLHPDTFWDEIKSTFTEGTSEGTGEDRWVLWTAGVQVFKERPLLGVGPANFGPFAAGFFEPGEVGGDYANNPGRLYYRSLHSMWVQFLSERGVLGLLTFLWVLGDFWRRNAQLRRPEVAEAWIGFGGRLNITTVALGLEASMVAFLVTSAFYALVETPWLYSLLALNVALHVLAVQTNPVLKARKKAGSRRRGRRKRKPVRQPRGFGGQALGPPVPVPFGVPRR